MEITNDITKIWDNFHKELRAFIQNKTRNQADTDDILQDAFVRIIRNWKRVNQSENIRLYLYGIVRNTMYDHFKKHSKVFDGPGLEEVFTDEETQDLNTTVADHCVQPFIKKLPDHYREALMLTEFQDISQKDLAVKLGITYSGAKSRVQRGKEKLKELLLGCCPYKSDTYGNLISNETNNCSCS